MNKYKSEKYIKNYFKKKFEIVRLFSVISKRIPINSKYVIGNFINDSKTKSEIMVNSKKPKKIFRSFINSSDLIFILIKLFQLKPSTNSIYNLGSDEFINIFNLSKKFSLYTKKKVIFSKDNLGKKMNIDFYVPNINKLRKKLKIKKLKTLDSSIIECLK